MSKPEFKSVRYEKVTLICATETFKDINDPKNDSKAIDYIDAGASHCMILESYSEELHFHETETKTDNCIGSGVCVQKPDMESLELAFTQELIQSLTELDLLLIKDLQENDPCGYCGVAWSKHEPEFPEVQESCGREKITFLLQKAHKRISEVK